MTTRVMFGTAATATAALEVSAVSRTVNLVAPSGGELLQRVQLQRLLAGTDVEGERRSTRRHRPCWRSWRIMCGHCSNGSSGWLFNLRTSQPVEVVLVTAGPDGDLLLGLFTRRYSSVSSTFLPVSLSPEFAHSVDAGVGTSSPQRRSSSSQAVRSGGLCSILILRERERHP